MATTRLMPLHIGKGQTAGDAIKRALGYIKDPMKTENGILVTSYGCTPQMAEAEFMCNMDFNSDFDVSADSGVGYESDISSDSNFEGLDTVDDSNYESFDKVENISSDVNADTEFDLEELGAVDNAESEPSDLADNLDSLEAINDEGDVKSVKSETKTDLGSLEEIETDDLPFNEDETAEEASLEELPLNELYEKADDNFPKVLTRDITPEIIESRNSDTEEMLLNNLYYSQSKNIRLEPVKKSL